MALFFGQLRPGKTQFNEGEDDQREGHVVALAAATNTVLGAAVLGPIASTGFNANGQLAPAPGQVPAVPSTNPQTFTTPTGVIMVATAHNGIVRSVDDGASFGLANTGLAARNMGTVVFSDPNNLQLVLTQSEFGPFRSTDGGATWKAILTVDENTGAQDAIIDPKKPDTLYVAPALSKTRKQSWFLLNRGASDRSADYVPVAWALHEGNLYSFVDP